MRSGTVFELLARSFPWPARPKGIIAVDGREALSRRSPILVRDYLRSTVRWEPRPPRCCVRGRCRGPSPSAAPFAGPAVAVRSCPPPPQEAVGELANFEPAEEPSAPAPVPRPSRPRSPRPPLRWRIARSSAGDWNVFLLEGARHQPAIRQPSEPGALNLCGFRRGAPHESASRQQGYRLTLGRTTHLSPEPRFERIIELHRATLTGHGLKHRAGQPGSTGQHGAQRTRTTSTTSASRPATCANIVAEDSRRRAIPKEPTRQERTLIPINALRGPQPRALAPLSLS